MTGLSSRSLPPDTKTVQPTQEARLLAALDHERAWREMLQKKLATAEAARHEADEQLVLARAEVQRQRQASTRASNICTVLQERTLELEAALQQAEQRRTSESAAAADRLTQRHGEFTASLADAARSRDALAQQLSGAGGASTGPRGGQNCRRRTLAAARGGFCRGGGPPRG